MRRPLLTALLGLMCAVGAQAQIIYHDIDPDTTLADWDAYTITLSGSPHTASGEYFDIWFHPTPEVVITSWNNTQILFDAIGNFPAKLQSGDVIDASGTWKLANYDELSGSGMGNWQSSATDKYLGFRFKKDTTWHYGWLKMSVAAGASSFTVKEWAYNAASTSIKAGESTVTGIAPAKENEIDIVAAESGIRFTNLPAGANYKVNVMDMNGRIIRLYTISQDGIIELKHMKSGMYIVNLNGNGQNSNFKIVVVGR